MKKGEDFELLVADLERYLANDPSVRVQHNVKLKTKKGNYRTVDVLIEHTSDRFIFRTIIECRDKKSKVKATDVNAFKSLMENIDAHQGIIVAKAGFQSGALTEAKNERILLHTLSNVEEAFDYLKSALISQYHYSIQHIETVVHFEEKKEINKEINLFTVLSAEGNPTKFSIAQIVESSLQKERTRIPEVFMQSVEVKDGMISVANGEASGSINFNYRVYYEKDGEKTYLKSFDSRYKVIFQLRGGEIEGIKQYQDISTGNPIALITEVKVGEEKFRLIEKVNSNPNEEKKK